MRNKRVFLLILFLLLSFPVESYAALYLAKSRIGCPRGRIQDVAFTLQLLAMLTILSLAPAILILMTSFTRIIVVLLLFAMH